MDLRDFEARNLMVQRALEAVAGITDEAMRADAFRFLLTDASIEPGPRNGKPTSRKSPRAKPAEKIDMTARSRTATGKKQTHSFVKTIDFHATTGGTSLAFADFVAAHPPTNVLHKCVLAVYWLRSRTESNAVSVDDVYTAFKTIQWPLPADLPNTLQQAGSKNYLDSKDRENLIVTTHGENLVDHELKAS